MYDNWVDEIEPDPDPEEDRFSVFDEAREEYVSVYDVSRLRRWRRFLEYDWAWKVAGPLFRLRHNIARHFQRCAFCGRLGCGPYWFSNTCSDICSSALYACRVAEHRKLHIRAPGKDHMTLCNQWIWEKIKVGIWNPAKEGWRAAEFCSECAKAFVRATNCRSR